MTLDVVDEGWGVPGGTPAPALRQSGLDSCIAESETALRGLQKDDGHWIFEFEADATIPAEYVLLQHFLGRADPDKERKIARFLRRGQKDDGSWPLFPDGAGDLSATVKAYFALKLIGDDADALHMRRARAHVRARGGAAKANVFTRITLALFGQVPWRAVPIMPPEMMLLPRWFPFHLRKVSYWSRTVIAPLAILMARKPQARNPRGVDIRELFLTPPERETDYIVNPTGSPVASAFLAMDKLLKATDPLMPRALRRRAVARAQAFVEERLNGEDGLGAIFPAMANAVMALDALGVPFDDPRMANAIAAIEHLLVDRGDELYCQPCVSPVWDTALATLALHEIETAAAEPAQLHACDWLVEHEVTETRGDWALYRPELPASGWAFQYGNDHYPDIDDTAVVVMALDVVDRTRYADTIARATAWVMGMQSRNGGWGAFDVDNTQSYLNHIPFADHGALLDPPTADVSARCLGMLKQLGYGNEHPAVAAAIRFLLAEQEPDGSWYGRWGVNYLYGTWSVLNALAACGYDAEHAAVASAVDFLLATQRPDGGWGEGCASYWDGCRGDSHASTASQTAWALLGLMAAGEVSNPATAAGVDFLLRQDREGAHWPERLWTGIGFPRVFYLKYHGYSAYFPLWALARYRRLSRSNDRSVDQGI